MRCSQRQNRLFSKCFSFMGDSFSTEKTKTKTKETLLARRWLHLWRFIGLRRTGSTLRRIAEDKHLHVSTVHLLWRRWLQEMTARSISAVRVTSAVATAQVTSLDNFATDPEHSCSRIVQEHYALFDNRRLARMTFLKTTALSKHQRPHLQKCGKRATWTSK